MLSKPDNGWCTVTIGPFQAEASYFGDIPFEWLVACRDGLKYNMPFVWHIMGEGPNHYITAYGAEICVTSVNNGTATQELKGIDWLDLAAWLLSDIKQSIDDWVQWYPPSKRKNKWLTQVERSFRLKHLLHQTEKEWKVWLARRQAPGSVLRKPL